MKFDGTITAGTIISAFLIVTGVIGGAAVMVKQVESIELTMHTQGTRFEQGLQRLNEKVNDINTKMAVNGKLEETVRDHEVRIRELERTR